jgi:probable phosphoglycerate mutase
MAGYGSTALVDDDLSEWNYGEFEGLTTAEIRKGMPGWSIWADGPVGGESIEHMSARAMRVIERAVAVGGCVGLFSHAHFLRILAASWLGLPPSAGDRWL